MKTNQASMEAEIITTLKQDIKGKEEQLKRHDNLKQKLMEEIYCLSHSDCKIDIEITEITVQHRIQALRELHSIISKEEGKIGLEIKQIKKEERKKKKDEIPLPVRLAIQFGAQSIVSLLELSNEAQVLTKMCDIANDILNQLEVQSLTGKYGEIPEVSDAIEQVSQLFQNILIGKINSHDPCLALPPTFGFTLARYDIPSTLFLSKFLYQMGETCLPQQLKNYINKLKCLKNEKQEIAMQFTWEPEILGNMYRLEKDNKQISTIPPQDPFFHRPSHDYRYVVISQEIKQGNHFIEVEIVRHSEGGPLAIGLMSSSFTDLQGSIVKRDTYVWLNTGEVLNNTAIVQPTVRNNTTTFDQMDKIGILVQMEEKKMTFYKNKVKAGVQPITDLPSSLKLTCCLGGRDMSLLISTEPEIPEDCWEIVSGGQIPVQQQNEENQLNSDKSIADLYILQNEEYKTGENGEMKEINSRQLALLLLGTLESRSNAFFNIYKLNQPPSDQPLKILSSAKRQSTSLDYKAKTWQYILDLFDLDPQKDEIMILCGLQILKFHLFGVKLYNLTDEEACLNQEIKDQFSQKIQQFLSSPQQENFKNIQKYAGLILSHCFDVISKPADQLKFLLDQLKSKELDKEFVKLLLDRFVQLTSLAPMFIHIAEPENQQIVLDYCEQLIQINKQQVFEIFDLYAQNQQIEKDKFLLTQQLLTLQRAILNMSFRKKDSINAIQSIYLQQLVEAVQSCIIKLKTFSNEQSAIPEELLYSLKPTFLNRVISECIISFSFCDFELHLASKILNNLFQFYLDLKDLNFDRKPRIEKEISIVKHQIESDHPYPDDVNIKHNLIEYQDPAKKVVLKFDPQCKTEDEYDYLLLFNNNDEEGEPIAKFEGEQQ